MSDLLPTLSTGVVRVVDGPDLGLVRAVGKDPLIVGTSESSGLRLRDPKVSRTHCQITLGRRGFLVRDLGSRNGTLYQGSAVGEVAVPPGAVLRVGSTHLQLATGAVKNELDPSPGHDFGPLVGQSVLMRRVFAQLERASRSDSSVLLLGETGTGKELAARALHDQGPRRSGPFMVLECAALPSELLHSALFGHEVGAFTGATRLHQGAFERAQRGTLFLDEIAALPLEHQPTLLRALDSRQIQRVGSASRIALDVRVIASSRVDLAAEVAAGRFREDLFYRLNVVQTELPPLRARKEDLPLLCEAILRELGVAEPGPIEGMGLALLSEHRWPGNTRELRNVLERAVVLAGGPRPFTKLSFEPARDAEVRSAAPADTSFQARKERVIEAFERDFLTDLLHESRGNIKQASRLSGIERTQLKRMLRKRNLL
ncbi:MAG: sigma 54-interacting transcriptional regulator [Myxococcaceae bacterium]